MVFKSKKNDIKKIILKSSLFDKIFYLKEHKDVRLADKTPIDHYIDTGIKEDRKPNGNFNPKWYKEFYMDLNGDTIYPIIYYILHGIKENHLINEEEKNEYDLLTNSNLFDKEFYKNNYEDLKNQREGFDFLLHYIRLGLKEDRKPNASFDSIWYKNFYKDANPFINYISHGIKENHLINEEEKNEYDLLTNSNLFDEEFYKNNYEDLKNQKEGFDFLLHYIRHGKKEDRKAKVKLDSAKAFDREYYIDNNPDVKDAGIDPFEHYVNQGWIEGRKPNSWFDPIYYLNMYHDVKETGVEPLKHYLEVGKDEGRIPMHVKKISKNSYFTYLNKQNTKKYNNNDYVNFQKHNTLKSNLKLIAFYLPQFHPIIENDNAWGKGFTEWTNVSKALPQFENHYQPRLPGELGYYDLRLIDIQKRQIELAKNYGLHGFCYHYYWFGGKKVLEKPLEQLLKHPELDFPFCINWANENWTKRWDGQNEDIILKQTYSENMDIEFIKEVSRLFADKRYIRIDGKPLLMIYRPVDFPDIKYTAQQWRKWCLENGVGEIYLVITHSFEHINPKEIGFDAAVEFAPNSFSLTNISTSMSYYNKASDITVFDYKEAIEISNNFIIPKYKKFRSLFPSWDNEARKPGKGTVFHNASPELYKKWLGNLCDYTSKNFKPSEQLVFINAWNEWGEGAYIEPDRKYGYNYLETTWSILNKSSIKKQKIAVISHDAYYHGAQFLALNIARSLADDFGFEVYVVLQGDGPLIPNFEKVAVKVYKLFELPKEEWSNICSNLYECGVNHAIANTSVIGDFVHMLNNVNINTISLIHEMESVIKQYSLETSVKIIEKYANKIIFPSQVVEDDFKKFVSLDQSKCLVRPQGLFRKNEYMFEKGKAREILLKELGLQKNDFIVLNIAYGDYRKGIDLFVQTGLKLMDMFENIHFVWIGNLEEEIFLNVKKMIIKSNKEKRFYFPGHKDEISHYYAGSDVFFLSSREDPFPSVVMDAMAVGLPVVGFNDAGGFIELLQNDQGCPISHLDVTAAVKTIEKLYLKPYFKSEISNKAMALIQKNYNFHTYIYDLLIYSGINYSKVSVIIPNYNYENYLVERINSILNQSVKPYEIIFLDDNSKDNSVYTAESLLQKSMIPYRIISNDKNEGCFNQWIKGIKMAKGELIWIAEADDICELNFLEKILPSFLDKDINLAYAQSEIIDSHSNKTGYIYTEYTKALNKNKWMNSYVEDANKEVLNYLMIQNTIPNASAVVFKKSSTVGLDNLLSQYEISGDWFAYLYILQKGKVSYTADILNYHRRHENSIISRHLNSEKFYMELLNILEFSVKNFKVNKDTFNLAFSNIEKIYNEYFRPRHEDIDLDKNKIFKSLVNKIKNMVPA